MTFNYTFCATLLRTIVSRLLLIVVILIWFIPVLIYMLFPQSIRYESKFFFRMANLFYRAVLRVTLIPIRFEGLENVPTDPAIIAANHQSSFDVPLLGKIANGYPHVWLALAELRKSPLLRFILPRVAV